MDASGIDMQLLLLTAPGVQVLEKANAVSMAKLSNDMVADAVRKRPTRYAALAAVAPQDPQAAAKELERAVTTRSQGRRHQLSYARRMAGR